MTSRGERFTEHAVHVQLEGVLEVLVALEPSDPEALEFVEGVRIVIVELQALIAAADPLLTPLPVLDGLTIPLSDISTYLQRFGADDNMPDLAEAAGRLDRVLAHFPALRAAQPTTALDVERLQASVRTFRRSAAQYLRKLTTEADATQLQLDELETTLQELGSEPSRIRAELSSGLKQTEKRIQEFHDSKVAELESSHAEAIQELADEVQGLRGQIENLAAKVSGRLKELDATGEEVIEKMVATANTAAEATAADHQRLQTQFREDAAAVLAFLEETKTQVQVLAEVIADTGIRGGYQRFAHEEKVQRLVWQLAASGTLVFLVVLTVQEFPAIIAADVELAAVLARASVGGSLLLLATYLGRQANRHRQQERYNRHMELQLAAIGPYLAALPEETRHKERAALIPKLFMPPPTDDDEKAEAGDVSPRDLIDIIKDIGIQLAKR